MILLNLIYVTFFLRKNEKITVLDARETAPLNSSHDMFKNCSKTKGGCAIAVPGEIKGYWKAHQLFGRLDWKDLFQPAIEMLVIYFSFLILKNFFKF